MKKPINRRDFLKKTAAAGVAAATARSAGARTARPATRKVLFVWGGWPGHNPEGNRDLFVPWLREEGFDVTVSDTLDSYADKELMSSVDLIIQSWTMGKISKEQSEGLLTAVREGAGLAGWHGGTGDSFRENTEYQFMTGGQWVAHPGGQIHHTINITDHSDPITAGLSDFSLTSEQYYLHVDPANKVLATTTFSGEHSPWIDGAVMPVVWKKMYGKGRVFYSSPGHNIEDFDIPELMTLTRRGILWAAESRYEGPEDLVRRVYPGA